MSGQAIPVGPFIGGLNTYSDETAIADNQLVVCENFELDLDGSLKSRPPIVDKGVYMPLHTDGGNIELLGYFYDNGVVPYLIASDGYSSTYYFTGTSWELLTNTFAASALAQFNGQAWLLAPESSANPGGYWTPSGGFTAEPDMPRGDVILSHKFRLWISKGKDATTNGTRLYHSEVLGSSPLWKSGGAEFIDIGAGDGQNIVQIAVYYNNLLIFRTGSIYSLSYVTDPAAGVVSLVVPGVGLANKHSVVAHENFLYFMYDDRAYEFINSRAQHLNVHVPFKAGNRTGVYLPYAVSIFNQRVIFSFYDVLYIFSIRTRTWTTWKSQAHQAIGRFMTLETNVEQEQAIAHSSTNVPMGGARQAVTLFVTDEVTEDAEPMTCIMQTKNFNYEASSIYKRLFWWGADTTFRGTVKAFAVPIARNYSVTWGQLLDNGITWGFLNENQYTWGQPLQGTLSEETNVDTTGSSAMRKFVKFRKSLRFRQIYYRLIFETDGSISSAPVRVFSLMTYVRAKQRVVKSVS